MGIKSGYTFLVNKSEQKVHLKHKNKEYEEGEQVLDLNGKVVVVDGGILFKYTKRIEVARDLHAYKGPLIRFATNVDDAIVKPLLNNHGVRGIIFVLDGAPYPPKSLTQQMRRDDRKKWETMIAETEKKLEENRWGMVSQSDEKTLRKTMNEFYKKHAAPNEYTAQSLHGFYLTHRKVTVVRAPYEADHQVVHMQQQGICDYIIGDDSDLIAMGGDHIVALPNFREGTAYYVRREQIMSNSFQSGNGNIAPGSFHGFSDEKLATLCAMCGNDFLPNIKGYSIRKNISLVKEFFTAVESSPPLPLPVIPNGSQYCKPKGGSVVDYWVHLKKSVQAMLGSPVFKIQEQFQTPEEYFNMIKDRCVSVTVVSLVQGHRESWRDLGISADKIEELEKYCKQVLFMANFPKEPSSTVEFSYSMANLLMSGSELVLGECSVFRYFPCQIRRWLMFRNVVLPPTATVVQIYNSFDRVRSQPSLFPTVEPHQVSRANEASKPIMYKFSTEPTWLDAIKVYEFVSRCEALDTKFFRRIFPRYPSIVRRAVWLFTGGRLDVHKLWINHEASLTNLQRKHCKVALVKAKIVSSYRNSVYTVICGFVSEDTGKTYQYEASCSGGECVTSNVICSHQLALLLALRQMQFYTCGESEAPTLEQLAGLFPCPVKSVGTPILADFVFRDKLGEKIKLPRDMKKVDDGTDPDSPPENESANTMDTDAELRGFSVKSLTSENGPKKPDVALKSKAINVEQAKEFCRERATWEFDSEEVRQERGEILNCINEIRQMSDTQKFPMINAMIDSGEYELKETKRYIDLGDFSLEE